MYQWKERRWKEVRGSGLYPGQWNNMSSGMSLRDGFWTDVKELLQPSPQLTDPNVGDMSGKPLLANEIWPEVEDHKCEGLGKESHHKDPHSPQSITNLDPQLIETVQRFCNTNIKLPWLEGAWWDMKMKWQWKEMNRVIFAYAFAGVSLSDKMYGSRVFKLQFTGRKKNVSNQTLIWAALGS